VGLTECNLVCQDSWVAQMFTTTNDFFATSDSGITVLSNTPTIASTETTSGRRLEDGGAGVIITYDHTFRYTDDDDSNPNVLDLAVQPLADEDAREQFVADLKANGGSVFDDLSGVTAIDIPTPGPTTPPTPAPTVEEEDELLSENAIIGIAVGGGVILLALIGCLCCRKKDDGRQDGGPPPDVLKVPPGRDEVSTLGGPEKPYGDQRYVVLVIAFVILVS
jgi:hypothetical protein